MMGRQTTLKFIERKLPRLFEGKIGQHVIILRVFHKTSMRKSDAGHGVVFCHLESGENEGLHFL